MKKFLYLFLILFLAACSSPYNEKIKIAKLKYDQNSSILEKSKLDLQEDSLNHEDYLSKLFESWNGDFNDKEALWAYNSYVENYKNTYYTGSNIPTPNSWFDLLRQNWNIDSYKSICKKAIITKPSLLRILPSDDKLFLNPRLDGEGYPFDYLQSSVLSPYEPVFVSHLTKDKAWAFVSSRDTYGFVKANHIKFLNGEEAKNYQKNNFGVFIKDGKSVFDENENFKFYTRIGSIFPYDKEDEEFFYYQNQKFNKSYASNFLNFNDENIKKLINSFLGQNYGWGGENFLRDCSLFTRDYFASFGVFLERNSKNQGKNWQRFNLGNLNQKDKISFIKQNGIPFASLLISRGHVMIYAGFIEDDLILLQDAWGLRDYQNTRLMIGKIALTSAKAGANEIKNKNLQINNIFELRVPYFLQKN